MILVVLVHHLRRAGLAANAHFSPAHRGLPGAFGSSVSASMASRKIFKLRG
jgi:hypothetical protein